MDAVAIKDALRMEKNPDMDNRRKVIALSALGLFDFSIISLYQTGVIRKLPDIPLPVFDSNKVNASKEAYQFGVPDGPVSAVIYSLIMVFAAAGGSEKARKPVFDLLLGGAVAANLSGALYYLYDMAFRQKKICLYCVTGAAINIASAVIIAPTVFKTIARAIRRG